MVIFNKEFESIIINILWNLSIFYESKFGDLQYVKTCCILTSINTHQTRIKESLQI